MKVNIGFKYGKHVCAYVNILSLSTADELIFPDYNTHANQKKTRNILQVTYNFITEEYVCLISSRSFAQLKNYKKIALSASQCIKA